MAISSIQWSFIALLSLVSFCIGAPIHNHAFLLVGTSALSSNVAIILSVSILLLCVVLLFGCTCCPHKDGQAIANSSQCPIRHLNQNNLSQLQHPSEFAIFPPCSSVISLQPVHSGGFGNETEKVVFEPLPDILPKRHVNGQNLAQSSKPAHFSALLKKKNSLHDWFDDPSSNFPRNQLQYLREMGNGWFGRVVEGEAQKITAGQEKMPVLVKILREEASPSEHLYFLHEVRPYRNLQHVNVLRLLGRCLETDPFLLIMEHTVMDLKSYLIRHHDTFMKKDDLGNEQLLQWALDITSGLMHMHEHGFTHTDLAAHNCFLTVENSIKIGDYGLSFDVFREDYYCLGDIALPVRWYSPETLLCSETTIEAKDATKEANIWSLAVVFWELLEFGKLPYADMNNEEVLQNVIIERSVQLKAPQLHHPHKEQMFQVMQLCWNPPPLRPKIQEIELLLRQIHEHKDFLKSFASFEERWNALQSESNPMAHDVVLKFENDFVPNADNRSASIFSADGNVSESSAFELSGSEVMQRNFDSYLSASLRGLNGSFDEIGNSDSETANVPLPISENASARGSFSNSHSTFDDTSDSLQNLEVVTPEEISEAIRDFDAMLATEAMLLGVDSRSTTLERPKDKYKSSNHDENALVEGITRLQKLSEYDQEYMEGSIESINVDEPIGKSCDNLIVGEDDIIYERTISPCSLKLTVEDLDDDDVTTPVVSLENDALISAFKSRSIEASVVTSNELIYKTSPKNFANENKSSDSTFVLQTTAVPSVSNSEEEGFLQNDKNITDIALTSVTKVPSIPDIVIEPSVSCQENDDSVEEASYEAPVLPKLRNFRFVFKEDITENVTSEDSLVFDSCTENIADSCKNEKDTGKSPESSGPLTSTPTKDIAFFNDDKFQNFDQSSEDIYPDISFLSYKTSTTNSECYETAANTITSDMPPNSTDYETAASTFNLTNGSLFNFTNDSIMDDAENDSVMDTVFGNSCTFMNEVTSSTGITETSSFVYVEPKSNIESSDLTPHIDFQALDASPDISLENDAHNNLENNNFINEISGNSQIIPSNNHEAADVSYMQDVIFPDIEKNSIVFNSSNLSNASESFQPSDTNAEMHDDSQQNDGYTSQDLSLIQNQTDSKEFPMIELMNEGEETGISDTVSDSFAFKRQCEWSIMDDTSTEALTFSDGLTQSISDTISESFTYDKPARCEKTIDESGAKSEPSESFLFVKPQFINNPIEDFSDSSSSNLINHHVVDSTTYTNNSDCQLDGQEEITIEDLETEENTSYLISDNYEEQLDEDEVLKIDVETNEAILVDSTQSLIGFVPSRSIEMLQECNDIASHYDAPISNSLTVEETGSSSTSPASYSSKNTNMDVVSSHCNGIIVEHLESPESSPATIISSSEDLLSDQENPEMESKLTETLELNNNHDCDPSSPDLYNDVIFSTQPTKSIVWHSDETLDIIDDNEPNGNARSVIIESLEIMAGSDYSVEVQMNDTKSGLDGDQFGSSDFLDRLAVSPSSSPRDSVASTPCRDVVYTPDFESETEDSSSSCSSTSGSFECIHNKFKDVGNISLATEEPKEPSPVISEKESDEPSPMKIFSTTWDCHATPNKGLLKTPEKKVAPMRKSVSFHDEPQLVFQYPPASDSSEEECVEEANEFTWHVDYTSYADWDLQVSEEDDIPEEMIEIEELDSEPYNRSLYRGNRPLSGPAMYTITGFSDDEDLDMPEMKGSSQFSTFSDFRVSSLEKESPVRVSATNQGLSLIKEGPDGEEQLTIEEVFTGICNKDEKSQEDEAVNVQIAFPDNETDELLESEFHEESGLVCNKMQKDNHITDLPVLIEEDVTDQNIESCIDLKLPDVVATAEQPLTNSSELISVENETSKVETVTSGILLIEPQNDCLTEKTITPILPPTHLLNSYVGNDEINKNAMEMSEEGSESVDEIVLSDKVWENEIFSTSKNGLAIQNTPPRIPNVPQIDLISDLSSSLLCKEENHSLNANAACVTVTAPLQNDKELQSCGKENTHSKSIQSTDQTAMSDHVVTTCENITTKNSNNDLEINSTSKFSIKVLEPISESDEIYVKNVEQANIPATVNSDNPVVNKEGNTDIIISNEVHTVSNTANIMDNPVDNEVNIINSPVNNDVNTVNNNVINNEVNIVDNTGNSISGTTNKGEVNIVDNTGNGISSTTNKGEVNMVDNSISSTTDKSEGKSSEVNVIVESEAKAIDDTVTNNEVSAAVPSIVVTNAEGQFMDEELDEFLSDHFKFYENEIEESVELDKDEFMVTSKFSETPFEDTFGHYNGADCHEDFNLVEAINNHCPAQTFGDLFNFSEDVSMQNGCILDQSSIDEMRSERSTSLPVMNEEKIGKTEKSLGFSSL